MLNNEQEIQDVMHYHDVDDLSFKKIGKLMGFSERTARRRYKSGVLAEAANEVTISDVNEPLPASEPTGMTVEGPWLPTDTLPEIERFKPVEIVEENIMVTSDWHLPLFDAHTANEMIGVARANDITKLIVNGDFWHMDAFGHFKPEQPEASWDDKERPLGNRVMLHLLETFEEITLGWGNHDYRFAKSKGFKFSFEETMRYCFNELRDEHWDRIKISELDYMHLFSGGRKYRVCHPKNFSTIPLSVGRSLAEKHHCSVITGHSHHIAMGMARDGVNIVMESGGFYSKEHTEYVQKTSKFHEWAKGYISFLDGVPLIHSPHFRPI